MPNNNEKTGSGVDEITQTINQAKEAAKQEITKAEQQPDKDQAKRSLGERIRQELLAKKNLAEEAVVEDKLIGQGRKIVEQTKENKKSILSSLTKAIEAIKLGLSPSYISTTVEGQTILQNLADANQDFTPSIATTIHHYFLDFLLGSKRIYDPSTGKITSEAEESFKALKNHNSTAAKRLFEAINKARLQGRLPGLTEEELKQKFNLENNLTDNTDRVKTDEEWRAIFMNERLGNYLDLNDKNVLSVLKAISDPKEFIKYFKELKKHIKESETRAGRSINEDELNKKASIEFEEQLSMVFERAGAQLFIQQINAPYEQLIRKGGVWDNIEMVLSIIQRKISTLYANFEKYQDDPGLKELHFFDREFVYRDVEAQGRVRRITLPMLRLKETNAVGYLKYLYQHLEHIAHSTEYNTNVRLIFYRGMKGEKGFWQQMVHYVEHSLKTTDFDQMFYLPHYDIFQEAINLYNRYIRSELGGLFRWEIQEQLFGPTRQGRRYFEDLVYEKLKQKYKDRVEAGILPEWQLESIVSRAIGYSLGVILSEPEMLALADPPLSGPGGPYGKPGEPSYTGFWYSDGTPLTALSPHLTSVLRFQAEGLTFGPMAFLPVPDPDKVKKWFGRWYWDHNAIYEQIKQYYDTFMKGNQLLAERDGIRIIDQINPGRIGSVFTLRGWRFAFGNGGNYVMEGGKENYEKTFKRIDNIGWDVLTEYVNNKMSGYFGQGDRTQRMNFYKHLYDTYFQGYGQTFENFFTELEKKCKKEGMFTAAEIEKAYMGVVLARLFALRMPSKVLTLDKPRQTKDGKNGWQIIFEQSGIGNKQLFQETIRDLVAVETELRLMVSKAMYEQAEKIPADQDIPLEDNPIWGKYQLTEELLEKWSRDGTLKRLGIEGERYARLLKVFGKIKEQYINKSITASDDFLFSFGKKLAKYKDYFPFALAPEEIDYRFISLSATGETTIKRQMDMISQVEQNVAPAFAELMKECRNAAIAGNKDLSKIVAVIAKAKRTLENLHGKDVANKYAYILAYLTINFFQKDTLARAFGGAGGFLGKNSIAAEMIHRGTGIWEWSSIDIDRFIVALEQEGVLEREPYEAHKVRQHMSLSDKMKESSNFTIKRLGHFLGNRKLLVKIGKKEIDLNPFNWKFLAKPDFKYYSGVLRKYGYGGLLPIIYDVLIGYTPIFFIVLIAIMIYKAFKEFFGEKQK